MGFTYTQVSMASSLMFVYYYDGTILALKMENLMGVVLGGVWQHSMLVMETCVCYVHVHS